jgi:hypothetical protein
VSVSGTDTDNLLAERVMRGGVGRPDADAAAALAAARAAAAAASTPCAAATAEFAATAASSASLPRIDAARSAEERQDGI